MITSQRCVVDTPLTPRRFLRRAADVYPENTAIVDGSRRLNYTEAAESAAALGARSRSMSGVRCRRIALSVALSLAKTN